MANEFSVTYVDMYEGSKKAVLLNEGATVNDLLCNDEVDFIGDLNKTMITVNSTQATTNTVLHNGDKVAVTPLNIKAA